MKVVKIKWDTDGDKELLKTLMKVFIVLLEILM